MELIDTKSIPKPVNLANRCIYIIGPQSFQNECISYFLNNECDVKCNSGIDFECIYDVINEKKVNRKNLLLVDVSGKDLNTLLFDFKGDNKRVISFFNVALFNMKHNTRTEKEALRLGLRGFFYVNDKKEVFLKGIHTIFDGQLWVSRDVLEECIVESSNNLSHLNPDSMENNKYHLTKRELEILALVTVGTKNDEIANKLFISPHTVKTHLYNVFKKIHVANRLQAALWAAKNL